MFSNAVVEEAQMKKIIPTVYSGEFQNTSTTITSTEWEVDCGGFPSECSFVTGQIL